MKVFLKESSEESLQFIRSKKAVSEVVAVVFLIALSLLLASMLFVWSRSFFAEQVELNGKPIEEVCKEVLFDVGGSYADGIFNMRVINRGNADIRGFDIKFLKEKESAIIRYTFDTLVGESSDVQDISIEEGVSDLILYPVIIGSVAGKKVEKPVSCIYSGKTVSLDRVKVA
jgi:hypothetical protein